MFTIISETDLGEVYNSIVCAEIGWQGKKEKRKASTLIKIVINLNDCCKIAKYAKEHRQIQVPICLQT